MHGQGVNVNKFSHLNKLFGQFCNDLLNWVNITKVNYKVSYKIAKKLVNMVKSLSVGAAIS